MSPYTHATHTIYTTEHDVTTHQHKSSNGNRPCVTLVVDLSRIRHGRGPDIPQPGRGSKPGRGSGIAVGQPFCWEGFFPPGTNV